MDYGKLSVYLDSDIAELYSNTPDNSPLELQDLMEYESTTFSCLGRIKIAAPKSLIKQPCKCQ